MSVATTSADRSTIAMPPESDRFSDGELKHLWNDTNVSPDSLEAISRGLVTNYANCPPDVLQSLNRWAVDHHSSEAIWLDEAKLDELLGIEQVTPKMVPRLDPETNEPVIDPETGEPETVAEPQPADFSYRSGKGKESVVLRYRFTKNSTNRPLNTENMGLLGGIIESLRWVFNGEPFIFDSLGMAISAQHRGGAMKLAFLRNPDMGPVPVLVIRNIPAIFADTADTGRSRTASDILARDQHVLELESLRNDEGESFGNDAKVVRKKLTKVLSSALRILNYRFNGKDVSGSLKMPHGGRYIYDHFDESLDTLTNVVKNKVSTIGEGKQAWSPTKLMGESNLLAAIILCELREYEPVSVKDGQKRTVPQPGPDRLGSLSIDVDAWTERLQSMNENALTNSGIAPMLHKLRDATRGNKRLAPAYKFGATLAIVAELADVELSQFTPGSPGSPVPKSGTVTGQSFPHFGGADIGYQEKPAKTDD